MSENGSPNNGNMSRQAIEAVFAAIDAGCSPVVVAEAIRRTGFSVLQFRAAFEAACGKRFGWR